MKKILLLFILLVIIVFFVLLKKDFFKFESNFFSRENGIKYSLELEGTVVSGWKGKEKQWEIKAEKILVSKDERKTKFHNIFEGKFFRDKKVVANFLADKGVWDKVANNLEISGDVELKDEDMLIEGEKFVYTGQDRKLVSVGAVKITLKQGYIVSQQVVAYQDLEEIELFENIAKFKVR